jgi:hypothetical protein
MTSLAASLVAFPLKPFDLAIERSPNKLRSVFLPAVFPFLEHGIHASKHPGGQSYQYGFMPSLFAAHLAGHIVFWAGSHHFVYPKLLTFIGYKIL